MMCNGEETVLLESFPKRLMDAQHWSWPLL